MSEAYRHQGKILEVKVSPEAAQPYFARALEVDPENPWAVVSYAQNTYQLNRDLSATLREFRRALCLLPGDQWLPVDIVMFLVSQDLPVAAREFCVVVPPSSLEDPRFADVCQDAKGEPIW